MAGQCRGAGYSGGGVGDRRQDRQASPELIQRAAAGETLSHKHAAAHDRLLSAEERSELPGRELRSRVERRIDPHIPRYSLGRARMCHSSAHGGRAGGRTKTFPFFSFFFFSWGPDGSTIRCVTIGSKLEHSDDDDLASQIAPDETKVKRSAACQAQMCCTIAPSFIVMQNDGGGGSACCEHQQLAVSLFFPSDEKSSSSREKADGIDFYLAPVFLSFFFVENILSPYHATYATKSVMDGWIKLVRATHARAYIHY